MDNLIPLIYQVMDIHIIFVYKIHYFLLIYYVYSI